MSYEIYRKCFSGHPYHLTLHRIFTLDNYVSYFENIFTWEFYKMKLKGRWRWTLLILILSLFPFSNTKILSCVWLLEHCKGHYVVVCLLFVENICQNFCKDCIFDFHGIWFSWNFDARIFIECFSIWSWKFHKEVPSCILFFICI